MWHYTNLRCELSFRNKPYCRLIRQDCPGWGLRRGQPRTRTGTDPLRRKHAARRAHVTGCNWVAHVHAVNLLQRYTP
jgi:hypothetical protein